MCIRDRFKFFEMLAIKRPIPAGINSRHELPDFFCREDVREMIFIENHAELIDVYKRQLLGECGTV